MTADQIWQAALIELQLQMTKATFDTWVKNTRAISHKDGIFVIGVPDALARDWLENRLLATDQFAWLGLSDIVPPYEETAFWIRANYYDPWCAREAGVDVIVMEYKTLEDIKKEFQRI